MPQLDRLERVTDLLLVLLDTRRPLSLREIADRVPGYPEGHDARRQAFERDKALLRGEGVPVLTVPVEGEDQQGYRIDPDAYYLPDLGLEPDEQAALNVAVAGVHLGEPIGRRALAKLGVGGESPGRETVVPLVDIPSPDQLPALPVLFDAVRQRGPGHLHLPRAPSAGCIRPPSASATATGTSWGSTKTGRQAARSGSTASNRPPRPGPAGSAATSPRTSTPMPSSPADPWRFGGGDEVEVDVLVDGAEAGRVIAELGADAVREHRDGERWSSGLP